MTVLRLAMVRASRTIRTPWFNLRHVAASRHACRAVPYLPPDIGVLLTPASRVRLQPFPFINVFKRF
jgi:hypothetical protein